MAQHTLMFGIRLYRWVISPAKTFLLGANAQCRFSPSCSAYALEAIARHGALAGSWLALKRVAWCHPWGGCGEDPVPPRHQKGKRTPEATSLSGGAPASTMRETPARTVLKSAA